MVWVCACAASVARIVSKNKVANDRTSFWVRRLIRSNELRHCAALAMFGPPGTFCPTVFHAIESLAGCHPKRRDVLAVGPYVDSIATSLPYPGSRVQVIAASFHEAKYCEGDQVRCERWFDPQEGGAAFILDVLVANGQLIRKWSEEKKQYAYRKADIREASQFAI